MDWLQGKNRVSGKQEKPHNLFLLPERQEWDLLVQLEEGPWMVVHLIQDSHGYFIILHAYIYHCSEVTDIAMSLEHAIPLPGRKPLINSLCFNRVLIEKQYSVISSTDSSYWQWGHAQARYSNLRFVKASNVNTEMSRDN